MSNFQLLTFEVPDRLFNYTEPVLIRWNPPSFTGLLGDSPYMTIWLYRHDYTTDIDQTTNPAFLVGHNIDVNVEGHQVEWTPLERDVDYNVTNSGTHQLGWERTVDNPDLDPAKRQIKYWSPGFHVIDPILYYGLPQSSAPPASSSTTPPTPLSLTSQPPSSTTLSTSLPITSQKELSTTSLIPSTSLPTTPPSSSSTTSSASSATTSSASSSTTSSASSSTTPIISPTTPITSPTASITSTSTTPPLSLPNTTSPAASSSTSTDKSDSQSSGVTKPSTGLAQHTAVGLGVALAILALALLCAVLWFLVRRRRSAQGRSAQGKDFASMNEPMIAKTSDAFSAWPPPKELEGNWRPEELDSLRPPAELPAAERGHGHT